jgi:hypothetical protein
VVGAKGFEPSTSWSRTRRASQAALRPDGHAPPHFQPRAPATAYHSPQLRIYARKKNGFEPPGPLLIQGCRTLWGFPKGAGLDSTASPSLQIDSSRRSIPASTLCSPHGADPTVTRIEKQPRARCYAPSSTNPSISTFNRHKKKAARELASPGGHLSNWISRSRTRSAMRTALCAGSSAIQCSPRMCFRS